MNYLLNGFRFIKPLTIISPFKLISELSIDGELIDLNENFDLTISENNSENTNNPINRLNFILKINNQRIPLFGKSNLINKIFNIEIDNFFANAKIKDNVNNNVNNNVNSNINNNINDKTSKILFKEYLQNIQKYTDEKIESLYSSDIDKIIFTTIQACVLIQENEIINLEILFKNQQPEEFNSEILLVIVSQNETFIKKIEDQKQGIKVETNFIMSFPKKDKEDEDVLFIFQIPIKPKNMEKSKFEILSLSTSFSSASIEETSKKTPEKITEKIPEKITEKIKGKTKEKIDEIKFIRNKEYPIKCSVLYCKIVRNRIISSEIIKSISDKFDEFLSNVKTNDYILFSEEIRNQIKYKKSDPIPVKKKIENNFKNKL